MPLNVLVTAAGSTIGEGIIKAIRRSPLPCRIVTTDAGLYAAGLYRGDAAYRVPLGKSPEFIDAIIDICVREQIRAICIGTDYELLPMAVHRGRIEQDTGAMVIVSRPEAIRIADDKWLTNEFLRSNGFPAIPSAQLVDAERLAAAEGFPLIVKPRIGDSSKDTFVVRDRAALDDTLARLARGRTANEFLAGDTDLIVQKYMGDEREEFTSTTVTFDGVVHGVISLRREMRFGGHTSKAVIEPCAAVDDLVRRVATALAPVGPCNFQSRVVDGTPFIFEINCRFSGTTATCAQVGFNHVDACLRRLVLNEAVPPLSFRSGVMLRYFNEVFVPFGDVETMRRDGCVPRPGAEHNTYF